MRKLKGNLGIGHTRYSTSAASEEVNCQPFVVHTAHGALAVAHNGELVNTESLRKMVLILRKNLCFFCELFPCLFYQVSKLINSSFKTEFRFDRVCVSRY